MPTIRTFPGFDLSGRAVVVTGAGGHLGRPVALALAEMGAVVIANGRSKERLLSVEQAGRELDLPGRIVPMAGDVGETATLDDLARAAESATGQLDGWVNNAYDAPGGLLPDLTPDAVNEGLSRGLGAVILATQAAAKHMRRRRRGSIVNIASMYGVVSPQPGVYAAFSEYHNPPVYGAAKAGVIQFTRYAACHFGADGIRVNSISPGPFPNPSVRDRSPGFVEQLQARVPLGRVGEPDDLPGVVVFLLSEASRFVTGHNLAVDGGWTAW